MSADPPDATSGARPRPTDAEREARATWSGLAEPGDLLAGALVATLGAVDALRLVESAARGGLSRAWNEVVGQRVDGAVGADDDGLFPTAQRPGGQRLGDVPGGVPVVEMPAGVPGGALAAGVSGGAPAGGVSGGTPPGGVPGAVLPGDVRGGALPGGAAPDGAMPGGVRLARAVERWAVRLRADGAGSGGVGSGGSIVDGVRSALAPDAAMRAGLGVTFVVPGDPGWPRALDDLGPAAPFGLWVRGDADLATAWGRSVALVGSRASTSYGERVAVDLAAGLVEARACVVSGGAYGIDAAAHRGALARGGQTAVLLAGGVDRAYPAGNARMFEAVVTGGGALVAEVPPGSIPTKGRFLQRNRLIAAASRATVVVEAAWRSGAMSTAHHAVRLLRPAGAVPGPVTSMASAGCHRLLREGSAVCVTDAAEVLELVGAAGDDLVAEPSGTARRGDGLDPGALRVLDALPRRAGVPDGQVAVRAGVTVPEARAALGLLELDGLAVREGDRWRLAPG